MIKSELVQQISTANPHLYQRDVENIVNAILNEIVAAMAMHMTVGELARLMNAERRIGADLSVIKMENWSRQMWFDETNQSWVNPSPNMRSLTQATLYPGIGLLETTNLSVGRGTDTPFEVIGAPWLDGQKLALYLNQKNLAGVRFVPVKYKPNASVFKDQDCGGINIVITDREKFKPIRVGLEIATALRIMFPNDWKTDNYNRLWVNSQVFEMFKQGKSIDEIEKAWAEKCWSQRITAILSKWSMMTAKYRRPIALILCL